MADSRTTITVTLTVPQAEAAVNAILGPHEVAQYGDAFVQMQDTIASELEILEKEIGLDEYLKHSGLEGGH